jgi:hypothetical protein
MLAISDWFVPWQWTSGDVDDFREWMIALGTLAAWRLPLVFLRED